MIVQEFLNQINRNIVDDITYGVEHFEENIKEILTERECYVVLARLIGAKNLEQIGRELGVTRERIRQIEAKSLARLRYRAKDLLIPRQLIEEADSLEKQLNEKIIRIREQLFAIDNAKTIEELKETINYDITECFLSTHIKKLDFSVRTYNCLMRAGKVTIGDVVAMNLEQLHKIRNLGRKCVKEIIMKLEENNLSLRYVKEEEENE